MIRQRCQNGPQSVQLLTAPYQEGRRELRLQGPENMPEPTQLRIPRGRIPTPDSRLQPSSSGKGAPPKAAARALSAVLNQRSHGRPPTGLAKVPSHLAQEGALISSASFPEFLLVKRLNCGLHATLGKKANWWLMYHHRAGAPQLASYTFDHSVLSPKSHNVFPLVTRSCPVPQGFMAKDSPAPCLHKFKISQWVWGRKPHTAVHV